MSYGVDTDANELLTSLTTDVAFTIPNVDLSGAEFEIPGGVDSDLYKALTKLTNADLTTGEVTGTGTFDVFMQGMKAQLSKEYEKGRITGAEYSKTYIELTQAAMSNAVQYLLGRDQAYWAAVAAQAQAIAAKVALEQAKVQMAAMQLEAQTAKANYGLTKAKIATEDMQFAQGKYQLTSVLPAQVAQSTAQTTLLGTQNTQAATQTQQIAAQTTLLGKQQLLIQEQVESTRAQTLDVRSDGQAVAGSVGKQKALYDQQVVSYKRDGEVKATKLFTDAWITMKTMDEGLTPPDNFTNATLNGILQSVITNNALG
jgi:hypothetical protein